MKSICNKSDEELLANLIAEVKNNVRHATEKDIAEFLLKNGVVCITKENAKSICCKIMGFADGYSPLIATLKYHIFDENSAKVAECFDEKYVETISSKLNSTGTYVIVKAKFLNKAHLNKVVNQLNYSCTDPVFVKNIKKVKK